MVAEINWNEHPPFVRGTDLRNEKGLYREPDGDHYIYPSVTTVMDDQGSVPPIAHTTWVQQEVHRLVGLAKSKQKVQLPKSSQVGGRWNVEYEERCPKELLEDPEYLKFHGLRMQARAADRGTLVHRLMEHVTNEGFIGLGDLPYWLDDEFARGNGRFGYRCEPEDVYPYCMNLINWLARTEFKGLIAEFAVFNRQYGYAGTRDVAGLLNGELWIINLKTRDRSKKEDAIAEAAYDKCAWVATPKDGMVARRKLFPKWRTGMLLIGKEKAVLREVQNNDYFRHFKNRLAEYRDDSKAFKTIKEEL